MEEQSAGTIKKIGAGNKSLSVIVAEDKLSKFKRFSQGINLSMGYLLNAAIDRYLANNSTEIFSTPTGVPTNTPIGVGNINVAVDETDIEALVKSSIETYLLNNSIGVVTPSPLSLSRQDVDEMIKTSIDNLDIEELVKNSIGNLNIEDLVNTSTGLALEPLSRSITELKTYTRERFEELETRSIAPIPTTTPTKNTDEGNKSWAEFFKMLGIDALTATEAQRKENIDIRAEQIARGIQTAKEQGLGEWAVKVAGRSFVRVGD